MDQFFASLGGNAYGWEWIALGFVLCAAEMLLPGVFLLGIGLAAIATGGLLLALPLSFPVTLLAFGGFAVVSMLIGRMIYGTLSRREAMPFLNQRAGALVGTFYVLDQPIVNGAGRIRVQDSIWQVKGPDAETGDKVKVVAVEGGVMLRVELVPGAGTSAP